MEKKKFRQIQLFCTFFLSNIDILILKPNLHVFMYLKEWDAPKKCVYSMYIVPTSHADIKEF